VGPTATVPAPGALRTWHDRLRERYLKLFPAARPGVPLSWPVDADEARGLLVRWPARYQWPGAGQWVEHLRRGLRRHVRVHEAPVEQTDEGAVTIELVRRGKVHAIVLDYSDYLDRIHRPGLERAVVYFKMQYRQGGYGTDRIVPGGYVNPSDDYYKYIPSLRSVRDHRPPDYDVYGRFGLSFAREVRRRAVEVLRGQSRFRYEGSLNVVRYHRSLEEAARARVCIDLPGNGDFCFRLIDYLGIGSCVVAARHRTVLHVPLEDRKHIVYANDDLSDFVALCQYYLEHDDERNEIARNSRDFFDRYLHRDQLAAYYLATALERIQAL
jgi:Glycosyl transferases group 1